MKKIIGLLVFIFWSQFAYAIEQPPHNTESSELPVSDVELYSGNFKYSIPLAVPPGIHGFQPSLVLTYNSSTGNSWCGAGWDLSFAMIQRSTKKGIPKYDNSDIFVLTSGGNSQELTPIGNNEYRIKIDSSFLAFKHIQVTVGNQPRDYWTANDKYGNSYLFGLQMPTTSSIVVNPYNSIPFSWSLTAVVDKNGNRNDYYYTRDNNQIYLSQCFYNGTTITFEIEDREDVYVTCRAGFPITTTKRLKTVETKLANEIISKYEFTYTRNEAKKSLLSSVQRFGRGRETALPAITFSYKEQNLSFSEEQIWTTPGDRCDLNEMVANLHVNASTLSSESNFIDINSDGLPDHATKFGGLLNTGSSFVQTPLNLSAREIFNKLIFPRESGHKEELVVV